MTAASYRAHRSAQRLAAAERQRGVAIALFVVAFVFPYTYVAAAFYRSHR